MAQAVLLGGGTPICRVPWNEPGIIGKMLDAGIEGIIVPMVNSAAEAEAVVRAGRYVPMGARSFGPVVAGMRRADHYEWSSRRHRPDPDDRDRRGHRQPRRHPGRARHRRRSTSARPTCRSRSGCKPGNNDGEGKFDDALATIVAGCRNAGIVPGIHATAR